VQIPTTLLAQIDSSVGGKTAVNLPQGKNLLGAFYQPSLVICDVDVLTDLPKSVLLAGYGEMLKYALLDKKVYDELLNHGSLISLVKLCIEYKRDIVERDEKESNERRLLNLGHTAGHGIEKASNYTLTHGIAVTHGLKIMAGYSLKKGYIDKALYNDIMALIDDTVTLQKLPYSAKTIAEYAKSDKKRAGDVVNIVTIHGVGDCRIEKVLVEELEEVFTPPVYED
jgi:3-dehydroquinate synthase